MFFAFLIHKKRKQRKSQSKQDSKNSRLHLNRLRDKRHLLSKDLATFDARRRFRDDDEHYRNLDNTIQRMEVLPAADGSLRPTFIKAFKNPTCIRRAIRKRVLFAAGIAGRIKVRTAKWNKKSEVSCK